MSADFVRRGVVHHGIGAMPDGGIRMTVQVTRLPIQLLPDPKRVITRLFVPGEENRIRDIIRRLTAIPEAEAEALLADLESSFRPVHPHIDDVFLEHYESVKHCVSGTG